MANTVEYKSLKGNYVIVDVRSPGEYKESTINGAINIPLFDDEERATIGTIYTRESTEKATKLGVEIVSKKLPGIYDKVHELEKNYDKVVLFCARGGMRSGSISELLGALGARVERIKDGYKGYRAFINEELPKLNDRVEYVVLHGNTGVGKTEILKKMKEHGYDVLDLEGCANHRGSILGSVGLGETTSQKQFDSNIYEELKAVKGKYVFVEAESKRIGRVSIPEYIHNKMKEGIHIFVDADIDFRCDLIIKEYTENENHKDEICDALLRLKKHISEKNIEHYCKLVKSGQYNEVVNDLMVKYYDPLYMHSSDKYEYILNIMVENIEAAAKILEDFIDKYKDIPKELCDNCEE
ncbi:tRNA 2-selenouridine(34) synthase MnmH [Clostridium sp.]|uniref:tRNA 2-selenouridine(34) synthase MnmH n=1 Tax=Clostridium sp. TaxID=1506 RepID=UPI002FC7CA9F